MNSDEARFLKRLVLSYIWFLLHLATVLKFSVFFEKNIADELKEGA